MQLPLAKGDAVFFNPAVMHGAGTNVTPDIYRFANLLQVGSAFGRSIETVDRSKMSIAMYPVLKSGKYKGDQLRTLIAATAEGYSFPTNLDFDQPISGLNPETQAELVGRALENDWSEAEFAEAIAAQDQRKRA